jgi:hypothetical protein
VPRNRQRGRAFQFVQLQVPSEGPKVTRETFHFQVDKKKLQAAEGRDGHYLLRSNLTAGEPNVLWARYVQLTQIESVFRSLKSELGIRPIHHQVEHRADAHILIAFLAYCLQITLKQRLLLHAPGLTLSAVLEKLAEIQMINDRHLDSYRRSTVADSAALHAAFLRHQAARRKAEIGVAEPAATATHCANRGYRNRGTNRPVAGAFVVETFQ